MVGQEIRTQCGRASGFFMPVFSFPGNDAIGTLEDPLFYLEDFKRAGFNRWYVLPLTPTIVGDSPFQGPSILYGNPNLISVDDLFRVGDIKKSDYETYVDKVRGCKGNDPNYRVNYGFLWWEKLGFDKNSPGFVYGPLRKSFYGMKFNGGRRLESCREFQETEGERLRNYSEFMTLKQVLGHDKSWNNWPSSYKFRTCGFQSDLPKEDLDFYSFTQFVFHEQLRKLSEAVHQSGLELSGVMPLYPCYDCAEVWANKDLFILDEDGNPNLVACVPPDYYEPEKGQLWGNPLWRYGLFAKKGLKEKVYDFFSERYRRALSYFDRFELDHFRGYTAFGGVKFGLPDARDGKWFRGSGNEIFYYIAKRLGLDKLPVDVEDLGYITDEVERNRLEMDYPGMKIFQFADLSDNSHLHHPEHNDPKSVYYNGTHNNPTAIEFLHEPPESPSSPPKQPYSDYVRNHSQEEGDNWKTIDVCLSTQSNMAIVSIADTRGYGRDRGRFNHPGKVGWWNVSISQVEMERFRNGDVPRLKEINKRHRRT